MGHQIEYLSQVSVLDVQSWLDRLSGFYCSEPGDPTHDWEGALPGGGTFWAKMAPETCLFSLGMKYTSLWLGQLSAVEFGARFEAAFWEQFGPIPLVRLDEFLRLTWEQSEGHDWEQRKQPFESLLSWLQSQPDYDDHWHLLTQ